MAKTAVNIKLHIFRSPKIKRVVNEAIEFLNDTPIHPLPPVSSFAGVGVYSLYYNGGFEHYRQMAMINNKDCVEPIYVGKAVPSGWRTARSSPKEKTQNLHSRLREHARSIKQARNLKISDFCCKFIILGGIEADLITAIEAQLIRHHKPLWNAVIDGFGNHDPGSGRYDQASSEWDVLHPGRPWVARLRGTPPEKIDIIPKIKHTK